MFFVIFIGSFFICKESIALLIYFVDYKRVNYYIFYQNLNFLLMRKIVLVFLLTLTIGNFIILEIALTNQSAFLYDYKLIIGISFLSLLGFLRQHLLSYIRTSKV